MFKRYLWKLCWLAFALVTRGESMKKIYLVVIVLFFISTKVYTLLHNNIFFCRNSPECDLSHVLPDYREQISGTPLKYTLINTAPLAQVVVRHYELLSQHWSPDDMVTPAQWRHNVDIYIPETAKEHHALVVVNNGINYDKGVQITGKPGDFPQETLASISRDTNTIVISVSDIPNQYLTFQDDKKPLKEDESVSRSWALFMEAPEQRKLMPLNIPMVTALSQAMRLAKKELTQWNINSFIITGISKRGWTTWLSAIADPDVEAIVPFAIDLLDIDASLEHIYQSYGGNWPITFYPYYQQGIDEKIKSPTFTQLRQIIDPLRYLNTIYQPRLAIPKYIINASGDDFFVPDNTRFYYSKLPGVKSLRIVPNMNFSEAPVKVVRWTANNPNARDFRYACGIRYQPLTIDIPANNKISITLNEPKTGWEATYIEATFNDGYVATSQVYITPDEKYPQTAPPSVNAACQTLPGRGLGENDSLD
ncbi:PhoPQ-activated pathogenicity-related family protein [Salmonella enterica]|nr:PhoPQ-regulated protein [Salmonella enterica subsp. enterica serovar Newport]